MSSVEPDKLSSTPTQAAAPQPRRPRPQVWPVETGESLDTFATPSQATETAETVLEGPEPAVFGGLNPEQIDTDALNEPLGTPLEEAVRGDELIPEAPHIEWSRVIRSSWFLLTSMIVLLIGGSFVIGFTVPTETWVQTSIRFNQYGALNEIEASALRMEMAEIVRSSPLRDEARQVLRRKSPDVSEGFLSERAGLIFFRPNAIIWTDEGEMQLRVVDSRDPGDDLVRLGALVEAFHIQMLARNKRLDQFKQDLIEQRAILHQQLRKDYSLKQEIDYLLDSAQRYSELKNAMQELEQYLLLEDESNPLRLVARENLTFLTQQVAESRELSVRRDSLNLERAAIPASVAATQTEITRLERAIEVFAFASPPDPKNPPVPHDTRIIRTYIMRGWWIAVIVGFGALVAILHIIDSREAERARRERRELLKRRPKGTPAETK